MLGEIVHVLHAVAAGVWLGGVLFTMAVVSPALKKTKWPESDRVMTRTLIGREYVKVGGINLVLLLVFAILDGALRGFGIHFYLEYALLIVLFGLVGAHGAYFGRKLVSLAASEKEAASPEAARSFAAERQALQRLSMRVSLLDLLVSATIAVLAVIA
jgi:uncharacterized membrane protein